MQPCLATPGSNLQTDRQFVVSPPKRNRVHQSNEQFVKILSRVAADIGSAVTNCFVWSEKGVTCRICSADKALKGYFTAAKPCTDFNFSKFKNHILTQKHYV